MKYKVTVNRVESQVNIELLEEDNTFLCGGALPLIDASNENIERKAKQLKQEYEKSLEPVTPTEILLSEKADQIESSYLEPIILN